LTIKIVIGDYKGI